MRQAWDVIQYLLTRDEIFYLDEELNQALQEYFVL